MCHGRPPKFATMRTTKKLLLHILWSRLESTNSHQCTISRWGHSRHFGDEPKTHPLPMPKVFSTFFSTPKFSPPTYLTSFCVHSITRALKSLKLEAWSGSLKQEGRSGSQEQVFGARRQKWEGRNGNQKWELEARGQKQEGKIGSLKVSSLPSFHFFLLFC